MACQVNYLISLWALKETDKCDRLVTLCWKGLIFLFRVQSMRKGDVDGVFC